MLIRFTVSQPFPRFSLRPPSARRIAASILFGVGVLPVFLIMTGCEGKTTVQETKPAPAGGATAGQSAGAKDPGEMARQSKAALDKAVSNNPNIPPEKKAYMMKKMSGG